MGHRFSVIEYEGDVEDPDFEASVAFFRTMKLKWAKYLMAKLAAGMLNDIDIYNERELVSWRVYLKIFSDIRQKIDEDVENEKRKMYHPACRGFIMNPINVPKDFEVETTDNGDRGPNDDYTEDAASEYSDDDDDEEDSDEEESSSDEEESSEEDETDDEDEDEGEGKGEGGSKGSKKKKRSLTAAKEQGDDEEKGGAGREEQLALTDGVAGEEGSVAVGSLASIPNGLDGASSSVDSPDKSNEGRVVKVASSNESSTVGGASGTTTVRSRTKEWNAEVISPVFFGYSYVEEKQHDEAVLGEKAALRVAEERAVQRTKANRAQLLDEFEIAMKNQHANRTKKINKLQDEYDRARTKREEDLRRFQAELPPVAFNAYKATWELEYLTAEEAFDAEIGKMNDFHEKQCAADFETVQRRRDELEAFKDAESQVRPP